MKRPPPAPLESRLRDVHWDRSLEASSGRPKRHRLNRGGNRQLNYALHMMAIARCRGDRDTKLYMERQKAAGKSDKEAMRCLKRQLSNVVFRQLITESSPAISAV